MCRHKYCLSISDHVSFHKEFLISLKIIRLKERTLKCCSHQCHSWSQNILLYNHSGNFQQDSHMRRHFDKVLLRTRRHLRIRSLQLATCLKLNKRMVTSHIVYKAECNKHKGFGLMFKRCSQSLSIMIRLDYRIPGHFIYMSLHQKETIVIYLVLQSTLTYVNEVAGYSTNVNRMKLFTT